MLFLIFEKRTDGWKQIHGCEAENHDKALGKFLSLGKQIGEYFVISQEEMKVHNYKVSIRMYVENTTGNFVSEEDLKQ